MERPRLLFGFSGILGPMPFVPPSLEGIYFGETQFHEVFCHTGRGVLAGSGTIKDIGLVLVQFARPCFGIGGIMAHGAFDFHVAC